ncbi:MAG: hypothetical protein HC929_02225 [Leptolyngbyaceae cyanobacterium SM2_5_2]|nr:hypothetical protein [Leptolyngbyaceae cyanobacterium SM2_5_2]
MPNPALATLVEQIAEQLHTLSEVELRTVQDIVGYLVWKRDHHQSLPLPSSAETRAIERLNDLKDPILWVTALDEGEEIDDDTLNGWLKSRGYKD